MNNNIIKTLLSPKEFKKCSFIFNNNSKFKNEWKCFNNSNSWIQLFHDILILCNGIRSSVLIDYMVPEWEDFIEFIKHIKSIPQLKELLPTLDDIELIYLDEFLFFLINKSKLIERSKIDQSNSFSNYLFIDVSTYNQNPNICNNKEYHIQFLNNLIQIIINNSNNNQFPIKLTNNSNNSNNLELDKVYVPIISGWLCEYPIIYCNSGHCLDCGSLSNQLNVNDSLNTTDVISKLNQDWDKNNLGGSDLIKIQVELESPVTQNISLDILKVQSITRVCAFTIGTESLNNNETSSYLSNYQQRILNRFSNSNLKNYWNNIKFTNDIISNLSIRL